MNPAATAPRLLAATLAAGVLALLSGCGGSDPTVIPSAGSTPSASPTAVASATPTPTPALATPPPSATPSATPSASAATADVPTTAKTFFDALVAGDRAGVQAVATAEVVAQFEPYDPIAANADLESPRYTLNGAQLSMLLRPTITVLCTVTPGTVSACSFGE